MVTPLISPFKNLGGVLTDEAADDLVEFIKKSILARLQNLTDEQIRDTDKDGVQRILHELIRILSIRMDEEESAKVCEETQLMIALRFIKSPYMKMKLAGINEIKEIIDSLNPRIHHHYDHHGYYSDRPAPKYLTKAIIV